MKNEVQRKVEIWRMKYKMPKAEEYSEKNRNIKNEVQGKAETTKWWNKKNC